MGARITLLLALCFGMSFHPSVAWSQSAAQAPDVNAIGKVLTAEGVVRVEHPAAILVQGNLSTGEQTKVGDQIYRGDIIQTGPDGKLSAALADGSSFSVSANARMEVNEFVYDPHGHSNESLMSLTKGTFTFLAGEVAHTGSMKVNTPIGTMGIHGTAPRVEILPDGLGQVFHLDRSKVAGPSRSPGALFWALWIRSPRPKPSKSTANLCKQTVQIASG